MEASWHPNPGGGSLCAARDDNWRKLGKITRAGFHFVMRFQWHPGWCAVLFSSHCNNDFQSCPPHCPQIFSSAPLRQEVRVREMASLCSRPQGLNLSETSAFTPTCSGSWSRPPLPTEVEPLAVGTEECLGSKHLTKGCPYRLDFSVALGILVVAACNRTTL